MENGGKAERVVEAVRDRIDQARDEVDEVVEGLRGCARSVDGWVREQARERPLLAIACAAGLGFLVGRLASRA